MASDERSLLMTIAANHDADTPRLVYADWLDENATPDNSHAARAQFIRTQISILRGIDVATGVSLTPELTAAFTAHENELLAAHRIEWEAETHQSLGPTCEEVTFQRGFPCDVWVNGIQELIASRILEANTNTLTGLSISNLEGQLPELLSHPGIARLTLLDLESNGIGDVGAEAIAASPHLAHLTMLNLWNNGIGDAGAEAIAASPHLAHLTTLDLWNNDIGTIGAEAIAAAPYLKNLTTLNLRENNIGDSGVEAIAAAPHFKNLVTLDLEDNDIGTEGAIALATSQYLTNLTSLNLWNNSIGDAGAVAIAASPYLKNLTTLELEDNNIGTVGAEAIGTSPYLKNLTTLNLWNNNIGDAGAVAIAASPNLSLSAKVYALQSTGFNAIAEQVQGVAEGRYDGLQ
jgi:uncharacterized protein (TIGR02996 family)